MPQASGAKKNRLPNEASTRSTKRVTGFPGFPGETDELMTHRFRYVLSIVILLGMTAMIPGCYGGSATGGKTTSGEENAGRCTPSNVVHIAGTIGRKDSRSSAKSDARSHVSCDCGTPKIVDESCEKFGEGNWSCVVEYKCTRSES